MLLYVFSALKHQDLDVLVADLSKVPATQAVYLNTDQASFQAIGKEHYSVF